MEFVKKNKYEILISLTSGIIASVYTYLSGRDEAQKKNSSRKRTAAMRDLFHSSVRNGVMILLLSGIVVIIITQKNSKKGNSFLVNKVEPQVSVSNSSRPSVSVYSSEPIHHGSAPF